MLQMTGNLLFEWDFASYSNMQSWVFSFGDKVIVLEPLKFAKIENSKQRILLKKKTEYDI